MELDSGIGFNNRYSVKFLDEPHITANDTDDPSYLPKQNVYYFQVESKGNNISDVYLYEFLLNS